MVVYWRYGIPFDPNGCASTLVNDDFEVGINEQQKVYYCNLTFAQNSVAITLIFHLYIFFMSLVLLGDQETSESDGETKKKPVENEFPPNEYVKVGKFINGLAVGQVQESVGDVSELLIRVNSHTGQNWVIISEVSRGSPLIACSVFVRRQQYGCQ